MANAWGVNLQSIIYNNATDLVDKAPNLALKPRASLVGHGLACLLKDSQQMQRNLRSEKLVAKGKTKPTKWRQSWVMLTSKKNWCLRRRRPTRPWCEGQIGIQIWLCPLTDPCYERWTAAVQEGTHQLHLEKSMLQQDNNGLNQLNKANAKRSGFLNPIKDWTQALTLREASRLQENIRCAAKLRTQ